MKEDASEKTIEPSVDASPSLSTSAFDFGTFTFTFAGEKSSV